MRSSRAPSGSASHSTSREGVKTRSGHRQLGNDGPIRQPNSNHPRYATCPGSRLGMMLAGHHRTSYPMACKCPTIVMPLPFSKPKEIAMESIISNLLSRFEKGSLSRRELVQGLAMLAASGTAASAQEDINFKAANIDHVSV